MRIFDSLTYLGRDLSSEPYQYSDVDSLGRMLDKYGIEKALLHSYTARILEIPHGNDLLFEAAEQDDRLVPCPLVVPDTGGEIGDEGEYLDSLIRKGARSVCFYPRTCGTTLDRRLIGPLFAALEERRLPVAVFECDMLEVADLAEAYPGLPIIMHVPPARTRAMVPTFTSTPNLYISLAPNFATYLGLEHLIELAGADRILFGSAYPAREPGAPVSFLMLSDISDEDVEKIASKNMERLVADVRGASACDTEDPVPETGGSSDDRPEGRVSGVCEHVYRRERVPWDGIVDMHAHYGKWTKFPILGGFADDLVSEMDRVGVEKMLVSHHACMSSDVQWGNDQVLDAMTRYPGRLLGYAICYPVNDTLGIDEIRRCLDAGMRAIKLHTGNGISYSVPELKEVWELADRRKLPVLLHTWGDIDKMSDIFETYREAPILLGHSGAAKPEMYVEYAKEFPNLYLELCTSISGYGIVEYFAREVGADRILFGSDAPWMSIQQQLGRVLFADISEEEQKTILIENPRRIFEGIEDA